MTTAAVPDWAWRVPNAPVNPQPAASQFTMPFTHAQLLEIGKQLLEQFIKQILLAFKGTFFPNLPAFTQLKDWVQALLGPIQEVVTAVRDLKQGLQNSPTISAIVTFVQSVFHDFTNTFLSGVLAHPIKLLPNIVTFLESGVADGQLFIAEITTAPGTIIANTLGFLQSGGKSISDFIVALGLDPMPVIQFDPLSFQNTLDNIKSWFSNLWGTVLQAILRGLGLALITFITSIHDAISTYVHQFSPWPTLALGALITFAKAVVADGKAFIADEVAHPIKLIGNLITFAHAVKTDFDNYIATITGPGSLLGDTETLIRSIHAAINALLTTLELTLLKDVGSIAATLRGWLQKLQTSFYTFLDWLLVALLGSLGQLIVDWITAIHDAIHTLFTLSSGAVHATLNALTALATSITTDFHTFLAAVTSDPLGILASFKTLVESFQADKANFLGTIAGHEVTVADYIAFVESIYVATQTLFTGMELLVLNDVNFGAWTTDIQAGLHSISVFFDGFLNAGHAAASIGTGGGLATLLSGLGFNLLSDFVSWFQGFANLFGINIGSLTLPADIHAIPLFGVVIAWAESLVTNAGAALQAALHGFLGGLNLPSFDLSGLQTWLTGLETQAQTALQHFTDLLTNSSHLSAGDLGTWLGTVQTNVTNFENFISGTGLSGTALATLVNTVASDVAGMNTWWADLKSGLGIPTGGGLATLINSLTPGSGSLLSDLLAALGLPDVPSLANWLNRIDPSQMHVVSAAHIVNVNPNLLDDPGFDSSASVASGSGWVWDGSVGHTNLGSAKAVCDGSQMVLESNAFLVTQGDVMNISLFAQWASLTTSGSSPAPISLQILPYLVQVPAGAPITVVQLLTPAANSGGWTELSGTWTVPAGVDTAFLNTIVDTTATGGTVWVDDGGVSKAGALAGGNLVTHAEALLTSLFGGNTIADVLHLPAIPPLPVDRISTLPALVANLGATGLYDVSQGFHNLAISFLKNIDPTTALYDVSQGFHNLATSFLKNIDPATALYDVSQGFHNLATSFLKNIDPATALYDVSQGFHNLGISFLKNIDPVSAQYDASKGFNNLGSSLLQHLTPTGSGIGKFDASQLTNTATSFLKNLDTSSGLYDASQGFKNATSSILQKLQADGTLALAGVNGLAGYLTNMTSGGNLALAAVTGLTGFLTHLGSGGIYDASAGFLNQASSILRNIDINGRLALTSVIDGFGYTLDNYLQNLDLFGRINGSAILGQLSTLAIPPLPANIITSGNFLASLIPSLPQGWGRTIHGSLLTGPDSVPGSVVNYGTDWAYVDAELDTSSLTYIPGSGDSVTVTIGQSQLAWVGIAGDLWNQIINCGARASWGCSGSNNVSPSDTQSLYIQNPTVSAGLTVGCCWSSIVQFSTPGPTTFQMYYKAIGANSTAKFAHRRISVFPL